MKSIVRVRGAVPAGAIVPKAAGNAGLPNTGVQAAPEVCVSVALVAWAATAAPGPGFVMLKLHTRAFCGPVLPSSVPPSDVGPGAKFAVTVTDELTVMVCGFVVPLKPPENPVKT